MGNWDQFDDEEEDQAFRDAMEMAESVKDGWGACEQLEACLAVAEAALLSKAAKAQRREQAEEERRREARERAMTAQREREEREAREIVAAREREALRARREREARQSAIPATPAGPSAEELRRQERERQVAAEERAAKVRLANAQAAEIEAKAELMRAQARAAVAPARVAATGAGEPRVQPAARPESRAPAPVDRARRAPSARREARTALEVAVKAPVAGDGRAAPGESPIEAADRAALMSVGRWPPPPARPDSPFWTADADWPADWTLTGYDLAIFRGHLNVSQAVFAGQVGVPTVEITRAEARPKAKVRPALQVAVRAAMEEARKARENPGAAPVVGTTRASPVAAVAGGPTAVGPVEAPGPAAAERGGLAGADLARWRAAAGLTQREAAVKLGVAHGTVAKAELASGKQLGKQMGEALEAARRT